MIEPWFPYELAKYFSLLALLALLSGLEPLAVAGRAKTLVLACYFCATAGAALLFLVGMIALFSGQPVHVYGTMLFAGGLTFGVFLYHDFKLHRMYQAAEFHRSVADDL